MNAKRLATPVRPRLEATNEQIDALNAAVILALFSAEREVANRRREIERVKCDLEVALDAADKSFYADMLVRWQGHLQHDQAKLDKARAALELLNSAQIVRIESKS